MNVQLNLLEIGIIHMRKFTIKWGMYRYYQLLDLRQNELNSLGFSAHGSENRTI